MKAAHFIFNIYESLEGSIHLKILFRSSRRRVSEER